MRQTTLPDETAVNEALEQICSSTPFCHTQQCQQLLRYIVRHSLSGEEQLLRERVIGAEVFGRRPDYETGEDPIVRLRAADVRKRLAQFYHSGNHRLHAPSVQIEIPSGSYRAIFHLRERLPITQEPVLANLEATFTPAPQPPAPAIAPEPVPVPRHSRTWMWAAVLTTLALVCLAGWLLLPSAQTRAFHSFWRPWTGSSKPVIIAIGSNAVYRFTDAVTDQYAREHNLQAQGMEFFVPIDPNSSIRGADIQPAFNSFVALADVASVSAVVSTLTTQKQAYQERFPNDVSFAELRNSDTVLIGGFDNPMTIELTRNLPFVLRARNKIDDTRNGHQWTLHASNDSHETEDYAIITRLAQHSGDAPILSVAGMGQYGTLAAADFICSPASVAQLTRQLPADWTNRNLQVVLHVHVVDFKPVSSDVVAQAIW